jgi:hypothetical protein
MKGTFQALNPNAEIFLKLKSDNPHWWNLFKNSPELYIEIRKDNYINVYYQGGSLAEISYAKGFVARTHQKYLGDNIPRGKSEKGTDIFEYDLIDLNTINEAPAVASNRSRRRLRLWLSVLGNNLNLNAINRMIFIIFDA